MPASLMLANGGSNSAKALVAVLADSRLASELLALGLTEMPPLLQYCFAAANASSAIGSDCANAFTGY